MKSQKFYELAHLCWQNGELVQAEEWFRKLLRRDGSNRNAIYDLGVLLLSKEDFNEAAQLLRKATVLLPNDARAFNNLGLALHRIGVLDSAVEAFNKAIGLRPNYSSAYFNRALLKEDLQDFFSAIDDLNHTLSYEPNAIDALVASARIFKKLNKNDESFEALNRALGAGASPALICVDMGNIFYDKGDLDEAMKFYEKALKGNPKNPKALYQQGLVFLKKSHTDDALSVFLLSSEIDKTFSPSFIEAIKILVAHNNLDQAVSLARGFEGKEAKAFEFFGYILSSNLKEEDAIPSFQKALTLNPSNAKVSYDLAGLLSCTERVDEALEWNKKALKYHPNDTALQIQKGALLRQLGRLEEAEQFFDEVTGLFPKSSDLLGCKAQLYLNQGRWEDAKSALDLAESIDPDSSNTKFNFGLFHLLHQNFLKGWAYYSSRSGLLMRNIISPEARKIITQSGSWRIELKDVQGKRALVLDEQGLGDTVMFCSMLRDLECVATSITLAVNNRLVSLLRNSFPKINVIGMEQLGSSINNEKYDISILIGELGNVFRLKKKDFPGTPYLEVCTTRKDRWGALLRRREEKFVGISWRGGATIIDKSGRSISPRCFAPLQEAENYKIVSLQFRPSQDEIDTLTQIFGDRYVHLNPDDLLDLHDLAALIASLDHVVTVQNTNVHLSGALGVPCDVLLPAVPEWRYGLQGDDMIWYKSVKLWRRESNSAPDTAIRAIVSKIK